MLEMKAALTTIDHPKKAALLRAYAECGTVTKAAEVANTARGNHRLWRAKDPAYAEAFEEAKEIFRSLRKRPERAGCRRTAVLAIPSGAKAEHQPRRLKRRQMRLLGEGVIQSTAATRGSQ